MDKLKASQIIEIDDNFIDQVAQRIAEISENNKTHYTPAEIAAMTPFKVATIRRHIRQGKLQAVHKGRGWIVNKNDLEIYLKGC